MDSKIEDFKKNIIMKFHEDIKNLYMIRDYIILENLEECNNIISEVFNDKETEKITSQHNGKFSILINKKFLLIAKKDNLISIFGEIYKFLLFLSKNIKNQKSFILSNIKELLSLTNLVLLFNDNITFYSLKKKILLLALNCKNEIGNINDIISNEYYFTCTTNKKCRKSAISWDYKYFLYINFKNDIFIKEEENNLINSSFILNLLDNEINIIKMKKEDFISNLFILKDLEIINEINVAQNRNCHMWAYLRKIYNEMNKYEKIIILLYSFLVLRKCSFDYSAFSFIVNSKKSQDFPLSKEQVGALIEDMKKVAFIHYDEHKCYINNLDKFLLN